MARNKVIYRGKEYTRIQSGNCYLAASLPYATLEANTFSFVLESDDTSLAQFTRNAPLVYYHNDRQIGTFYVQEVQRVSARQYEFHCTSAIGLLSEGEHNGGIYSGILAADLIRELCGSIPVMVKSTFRETMLYGWLPIDSPRNNLAQVLFAIGATVSTDFDGALHVEPFWAGISGEQKRLCKNAKVLYGAAVTAVQVTEHQFVEGTEEVVLFDGTTQEGDKVSFYEPIHSLAATGFEILESGANYAVLSAGTGTLTGKTYMHSTRVLSRTVSDAAEPNVKTVDPDATLISVVNSVAVLDRMAEYYQHTESIVSAVYLGGEKPGDIVETIDPFEHEKVLAIVKSADISISGVLKAQQKMLVGYFPPTTEKVQYFDERKMLTGSGSFEVPAGTKSITVVCISGGQGGASGANGNDAEDPPHTANYGAYQNGPAATGGAGGAVGSNGRVTVATIDVSPGSTIAYSCGIGGKGGTCVKGAGNAPGENGTDSVFGSVTSASGSVSEEGYLDAVTGEKFANTVSLTGINGGDGSGSTGSNNNTYVRGPSVFDREGNEWVSGVTGDKIAPNRVQLSVIQGNAIYITSRSGSGGGAAVGANGENGYPNSVTSTTVYTGTGGKGADAVAPGKQTNPGSGGHGGHGGGGAGGAGGCSSSLDPAKKTYLLGPNGKGGMGSAGGDGGDGCIILYYSIAEGTPSGALMEKKGRFLLDATGRILVV